MSFETVTTFEVESCYSCHMQFAVTYDFKKARLGDHKSFHCPNGHAQYYSGKTKTEKERDAALEDRNRAQAALNEANHSRLVAEKARDKAVRDKRAVEKRIAHGVCPCCNKTFADVSNHMITEHKDFRLPEGKERKRLTA